MAAFVSHQWLAKHHPDPDSRQMRVLQGALKRLLTGSGFVQLDIMTEGFLPNAKPLPMKDFQTKPLFLWYDYFSIPQADTARAQQVEAINSIPAYVGKCRFFLALCPVLNCPWEAKVLSAATWSRCNAEDALGEEAPFVAAGSLSRGSANHPHLCRPKPCCRGFGSVQWTSALSVGGLPEAIDLGVGPSQNDLAMKGVHCAAPLHDKVGFLSGSGLLGDREPEVLFRGVRRVLSTQSPACLPICRRISYLTVDAPPRNGNVQPSSRLPNSSKS